MNESIVSFYLFNIKHGWSKFLITTIFTKGPSIEDTRYG